MAAEFYGLALSPNRPYRLAIPEDVELQLNHACIAPAAPAGVSRLSILDLDEDESEAGAEEVSLARLSAGGLDCQRLKALLRCAAQPQLPRRLRRVQRA